MWILGLKGLSNDDRDVNENGKKAKGLDWQNNSSARASRFFVHFSAVTARLRRENAYFHVLWKDVNTRQRLSFSFPEHRYSLLEFNSRENWQHLINWTRWNKCNKFETARLHFLSPLLLSISTLKHYVHQVHHAKHKWINLKGKKTTKLSVRLREIVLFPQI